MSGRICDLCDRTPCGGVVVTFDKPTPYATWGKICWHCMPSCRPWPPSPQVPEAWQQWVAQHRKEDRAVWPL
jgi:hypothetical protein